MENQEVMVSAKVSNGTVASNGDGLEHQSSGFKESENLGDHLLEGLDSYLEDIDDRLTISRMVTDSVIRGMVNAVEQEAAEKISAKELEVARLKETLHFNQVGRDEIEFSGSLVKNQSRNAEFGLPCSFSNAFVDHGKMRESLGNLKSVVGQQIKKLKKEIYGIRGCKSIKRIGSVSELVGLGGILQEKASETWVGVDKTLDALKSTLDGICTQVDGMLNLATASVCEWQKEREFQGELEAMVIQSCIRSLQEEFEGKLWDQIAHFCSSQRVNWHERINEISSLRTELDVISKWLSGPETMELISHGSYDLDHFQHKALSSHISSSTSVWEENGKFDESKTGMPENWDPARLKNMSREALVKYVTEMKRNHETTVQQKTEELFTLKGKYLKDRGSSLHLRKDKEFDTLRRKIPDIILKLDSILVENEKLLPLSNKADSLNSLMVRLENLLLENQQLRDSLTDKKKEVHCLSTQVSDAAANMLQYSLTETDSLKLIENLKSSVEDAHIEAFVSKEVNKCILREMTAQIKCGNEETELECIEDSVMKSLIMQGLCEVIFKEAFKDAESQLNNWTRRYIHENKIRVSLEMEALEREKELRLELKESQEVLLLAEAIKEKEKIAEEVSAALTKEKEQFELASQELHSLRDRENRQQTLISESSKELKLAKGELVEALEQIDVYKAEINKLNQQLEKNLEEFREADEQRNMLLIVTQEKQNTLSLVQAKEEEQRKQMGAVIVLVHGLSNALADYDCKVAEGIKKNNLRLDSLNIRLNSLIQKANILGKTQLSYKQRLERRCSDLQMAEAEVDLLGDEVDVLLSLLEKIYIALDHYSPILQHYPGIIEILKLVRRELSGESTKPV
ncbi:WPP domain-associated protein-like [Cornus florida]|uniref:WPP domain-associated protein-like n=1 Tax=Cornus florida TaxID=4283 RepID=UPI0028A02F7E|nr:WPP domain-associated protein-like [Cornus florida]XP_059666471.1 WPP domain-associated protein-like [Cornus florida]